MRAKVELLAPAGSMESMKAAISAGADAVYMGGSRFGARAYADNPEKDGFLSAIDYAHLHGRRLYMTVNTLVKEHEMGELYGFLAPYYERGLDAVIVQDLGVFSFIRKEFPDLPVHASTQMTVTGPHFAKELRRLGAARVVTARELSLTELRRIRQETDIEIESFVHGALCYCYSGQCLMSSFIGGRSGNRGRCAQPCRLPYEAVGAKDVRRPYLLNLKDLCTLDILPDIIEAGVYSLKIEGRMKSPRYTAGVVSVYRKYVDRYLSRGRKDWSVDPEDRRILLELFDRGGQTEGYYRQHNGRDMIAAGGKPAFREADRALFDRLDKEYVEAELREPVAGAFSAREGEPMALTLTLSKPAFAGRSPETSVTVTGAAVQTAKNQPMTEERFRKQLDKTGGSPFFFEDLSCRVEGKCFVPVQALNELRRNAMEELERQLLSDFRRTARPEAEASISAEPSGDQNRAEEEQEAFRLHVSLEEPEGLPVLLASPDVSEIYLDACGFSPESWEETVRHCREAGKRCALILPQIFRAEAERLFLRHLTELSGAGFDELVVRSLEEPVFLRESGISLPLVFDANLYTMNRPAADFMVREGASRLTLPLELNRRELAQVGCAGKELLVYGYLPAMVSAQCIRKTTRGCLRRPELLFLKDRTGKELPVKNHCAFCYNTVYNPAPLSLFGQRELLLRLRPAVLRLQFTLESPGEIRRITDAFAAYYLRGEDPEEPVRGFTRGHFKRGVE